MQKPAYPVGQAVFIRTDTPDYAEEAVSFNSLQELVQLCSKPRPNLVLEKILICAMQEGEPCAVTLAFVSASRGQRPQNLPITEQ